MHSQHLARKEDRKRGRVSGLFAVCSPREARLWSVMQVLALEKRLVRFVAAHRDGADSRTLFSTHGLQRQECRRIPAPPPPPEPDRSAPHASGQEPNGELRRGTAIRQHRDSPSLVVVPKWGVDVPTHELGGFVQGPSDRDVLDAELGRPHHPQHQQCEAQIERSAVDAQR